MITIIDGQKLAEAIKDKIVKQIVELNGDRPNLAIVLIGSRTDSKLYVDLKEKEAKKVGIDTHIYRCEKSTEEEEIINTIECLNKDTSIDAILVQLPLPRGYNTDKIIKTIDPTKDVDRFHPDNQKILLETCSHAHVIPPVFQVVIEMLKSINCELENKQVCLLTNSDIFSIGLQKVLECQKAKVNITHPDNSNLKEKTSQADILITAIGKPNFIKKDMIKKDAIIIDIGITKKNKKVYGDANFNDLKNKASFISPVPGGVGPMTIAMLFKNTLELYKQRRKQEEK